MNQTADISENIICLCPNHHRLMDFGGLSIDDNYQITLLSDESIIGRLRQIDLRPLDPEYFRWHRDNWK